MNAPRRSASVRRKGTRDPEPASSSSSWQADCCEKQNMHAHDNELSALLDGFGLQHLLPLLSGHSVRNCTEFMLADRSSFLQWLKEAGMSKLADRQGLVSALSATRRRAQLAALLAPTQSRRDRAPLVGGSGGHIRSAAIAA